MIFRVLFFIFIFMPVLIVIIPLQFVDHALNLPFWNALPRFFHRVGCVFLGLRVKLIGEPATGRPTLLVSNHISWTDIIAIGSVADVTFVAKSEVRDWFFVGFMARLQRTIFVDRNAAQRCQAHQRAKWASAWPPAMPCCCLPKASPISARMCCRSARRWSAPRSMP